MHIDFLMLLGCCFCCCCYSKHPWENVNFPWGGLLFQSKLASPSRCSTMKGLSLPSLSATSLMKFAVFAGCFSFLKNGRMIMCLFCNIYCSLVLLKSSTSHSQSNQLQSRRKSLSRGVCYECFGNTFMEKQHNQHVINNCWDPKNCIRGSFEVACLQHQPATTW